MRKFTIFGIFILFLSLLILSGCTQPTIPSTTPTPTAPPSATTGSISGIVTEKGTGTPLSGVTVTVDSATTVTTSATGSYSVTGLNPGFHTLKFEKVGFKTETANVNVVAGVNSPKAVELENTTASTQLSVTQDSYIVVGSIANYGSSTSITIGAITATYTARMLFQFPSLAWWGIPPGAKVISAKLKLYKVSTMGSAPLPYSVYPITEEWNEAAVTWFKRTNFPWFTPGGSYDDTKLISSGSIPTAGIMDWEEIDITSVFEYWNTHDNYGLIIIPEATTTTVETFTSSDATSNTPYVEVEYYIP